MNIVLVHGIFNTGARFNHLAAKLETHGHTCYCPSLKPSSAWFGVADLAAKLADYINTTLGQAADFVLIGHSMGCLIARYYLQELQGYRRCSMLHAISGPHHGSWWACCFSWQGAIDMRPNSELLSQLQHSQHRLEGIALFSYRTPYDLMILPSTSSHWELAENFVTHTCLHNLMVTNKQVTDTIIQSIPPS